MDNLQTGLMVSLVGITVTFIALLIFIGVIVLLKRLFPSRSKQSVPQADSTIDVIIPDGSKENELDESLVAAIAAAVYLRSRRSTQLGAALLAGPGPYKTSRQLPQIPGVRNYE